MALWGVVCRRVAARSTRQHAASGVFFGLQVLELDFLFIFFCCHLISFLVIKYCDRAEGSNQQCGFSTSSVARGAVTSWGIAARIMTAWIMAAGVMTDGIVKPYAAFGVFFGLQVLDFDFLFTFFICHFTFLSRWVGLFPWHRRAIDARL